MALNIKTILQSQGLEFVFRQRTGKKAPGLIAELNDPFVYQTLVDGVVPVHEAAPSKVPARIAAALYVQNEFVILCLEADGI
jgi:hypothetical protein